MAFPNTYGLIFACICGIILVIGLCANLLVFSLFAKNNSLRKNRLDILLLSMTLADFLTLLLIPFTVHSAMSYSWPLGDTSCKVYQFLLAFSLAASTYSLCAVSMTRAMIITNPYQPPTMDLVIFMFVLVWALSFFISLPLRMFATKKNLSPSLANFTFCLPTIHEHHYQVVLSQNTRRASLMVFLAAATFSMCWLPGYVLELCVYLGQYHHGQAWEIFYFICTVLQYLHPCINPVVYVLLSKRYRHQRVTCFFNCNRNRVQPQVVSITDSL
uniref:G-protein coupled receptors family 1 profile domain-containing protein n=1 Tax=Knipowitschia caucasica TaxID=637954 RepID=A0AAV2KY77_KNICA